MKKQLLTILCLTASFLSQGQVAYSEDFDNVGGPTAGGAGTYTFPSGMLKRNVDNLTPNTSVSYVNEAWERREDFATAVTDSAAFSTSWYTPAGTANDFMWTNAIVVPANGTLSWNAVTYDPSYREGYEVRIMTVVPTGGTGIIGNQITNSTVLFSIAQENTTWTSRNVSLAAYAGQTVYIGFRNISTDKFLLLIDDINVFACNFPVASTNVSCVSTNDGSATVTDVFSSMTASSFTWAPSGGNAAAATNLSVGNYTCTIANVIGCAVTVTVNVAPAPSPTLSVTATNPLCNGGFGSLNTSVTGGTPGYTYLCSNGTTTTAQSNLVAGTYNYTVTDASGCTATQSATIIDPTAVSLAVNGNTSTCLGGTINLSANGTGGTGAITYTWMPGSISTNTYTATPTTNSTYTLMASDANGCAGTPVITNVTVNSLPTISAVTNNTLLCVGQTATLSVSGSATTYTWSTTENTTSVAVSPTVQTTYTVSGTDANGCENTTTVTQDVSTCTGIATLTNEASINVYPNPNKGVFVVELTSASKVNVMNALGQVVISETFEAGKHTVNINNLSKGVYFVKVMTNNKQQIIKVIKE